jgi:hypothetical protein
VSSGNEFCHHFRQGEQLCHSDQKGTRAGNWVGFGCIIFKRDGPGERQAARAAVRERHDPAPFSVARVAGLAQHFHNLAVERVERMGDADEPDRL